MKRIVSTLILFMVLLCGCTEQGQRWSVTADGADLGVVAVTLDGTVCIPEAVLHEALGIQAPKSLRRFHQLRRWTSLYEACEALNISVLTDEENGRIYLTSGILGWEVPQGYTVPVLMYHGITDDIWGDESMFLSPADMEAHLRYLSENGYDAIFFEDLAHIDQYDKPIVLTFDDGYVCNYTTLYPMLQKYQMKATINIVTTSIGSRPTSMTPEMVRELADSGLVSIQSHTVNHPMLPDCDASRMEFEIRQSKLEVARITGREPLVICYPGGKHDDQVTQISAEHYRFGIIVKDAAYTTGDDPFRIPRFGIYRGVTMEEFIAMLDSVEYQQSR